MQRRQFDNKEAELFSLHAEALGKSAALYATLRLLLRHSGVSAINPDRDQPKAIDRAIAVEYVSDFEAAVNLARQRIIASGRDYLWDDFRRLLLNSSELLDKEFRIPADNWRALVRVFGRILHERKICPREYFHRIKRRTPSAL